MKAYVLHDINDIRLEEVENPILQEDEVLVEVKAAGICGSDIPRIFKTGTYSYPLIPGHEFSGKVVQIGSNVHKSWIGKRVGVFPLIPCKKCVPCENAHYELCREYSYLGSRTNGGFAEYVVVPETNLIEIPNNISYEVAAMLEPMAVAVHSIRNLNVEKKDSVVVYGLGTIGIFVTMFLKEAGIENIFVVGNKDFQKEMILKLGISENNYCDSQKENVEEWIKIRTQNMGADVFFECIGKNETITTAINNTCPNGIVQLIGNPSSDIMLEKDIYWKILRNQLTIKGSWNSSFTNSKEDDWHYVLEKLITGKIYPEQYITQKFSFEKLEKGLHIMRNKTEEYVKVMIIR